jgi:hypothetical protein
MENPERPSFEEFTTGPLCAVVSGGACARSELEGVSSESDSFAAKDPPVDGVLRASTDFPLVFNLESVVVATRLGENEPKGGTEPDDVKSEA